MDGACKRGAALGMIVESSSFHVLNCQCKDNNSQFVDSYLSLLKTMTLLLPNYYLFTMVSKLLSKMDSSSCKFEVGQLIALRSGHY